MSATNITQFKGDIEGMVAKLGVKIGLVQKKVAVDLYDGIVRRTPVDTGRARANWRMTLDTPSDEVIGDGKDKGVKYPAPNAPDIETGEGEHSIFIINNLAYIEALENGHSKQAPNGMVALAIAEEQAKMESALRNLE